MNVSEKRAKSKGHILCAFENRTDKTVHASSIDRIILDNCQGILICILVNLVSKQKMWALVNQINLYKMCAYNEFLTNRKTVLEFKKNWIKKEKEKKRWIHSNQYHIPSQSFCFFHEWSMQTLNKSLLNGKCEMCDDEKVSIAFIGATNNKTEDTANSNTMYGKNVHLFTNITRDSKSRNSVAFEFPETE